MRIAYVCQSYPPMVSGAAIAVQRLAAGMVGRGHEALVLAASDRRQPYVETRDGLCISRLRSLPNPFRAGQCFSLWPRRDLFVALSAFRPDIVHLHDTICVGLCGMQSARVLGLPVAVTVHSLPSLASSSVSLPGLRGPLEAILWRYAGWLLRRCHAVVTPSRTVAEMVYDRAGRMPDVIGNGIDLHRFVPCPLGKGERVALCTRYGIDPDLPVILHVGRIDVEKRVDLVVQAAALAMRSVKAQLLVVGDGTEREAMIALSRDLGIGSRCRFTGFVAADGDLPGLYRLGSVLCTASEIETQSLVVLEAAASGLPVVAVHASSMPEFVHDGRTGFLVSPRDVAMLAAQLVKLLREPALAETMGRAGRAMAVCHSLERAVEAHEQLYRSLLTDRDR